MLLPPLGLESIDIISAIPKPMHAHQYSGGSGLRVNTGEGAEYYINEEAGGFRGLSKNEAEREYTITASGDTDEHELLRILRLPEQQNLDPVTFVELALQLLEGARWQSSDGELIHDPESRKTFLISALKNPTEFLTTVVSVKEEEEEVKDEVEEVEESLNNTDPLLSKEVITTQVEETDNGDVRTNIQQQPGPDERERAGLQDV